MMIGQNGLESIKKYFPNTCWLFPTRGLQDGVIIRFPEGFYLKVYYSETQSDAFDIVGAWNGEVNPCLNINVSEKDMKQWCSRVTGARAFAEIVHSSKTQQY
ncbi:MAG: hypothetical protein NC548_42675 [Lachnospiraceae bacterium]|nr:hypothetical protein [Lachnospiraceae bacterium]